MAKKPSNTRANRGTGASGQQDRQAKIQAVQKATSTSGANKITIAGIVAILAIFAVVGGVIWSQKNSEKQAGSGNQSPPANATVEAGFRSLSDVTLKSGAPTITIYEDFQCPACKAFEAQMGSTIVELATSGDIELKYHIMNFLDGKTGAKQSTPVANAAFCAAEQGKFQEFHDAAYAGQIAEGTSVTKDQLTAFAETAGVSDLAAWTTCSDAGKYDYYIDQSNASAGQQQVTGTPTLKINDQLYSGETLGQIAAPDAFKKAVADATK